MNRFLKDLSAFLFFSIETLLIFRFVLKLFGANIESGAVSLIYKSTLPLLSPFLLAFPHPRVSGESILEFTTVFAIFVYAFINYLVQEALYFVSSKGNT